MRFNIGIEDSMSSRAKIKILRYLCSKQTSMSEGELAKLLGISAMTVTRIMKELHALNFVTVQRIGQSHVWHTNTASYLYQTITPLIRTLSRLPSPLLHLKNTIVKIIPKTLAVRIILFGSVAQGTAHANSDIDLCIIVRTKRDARTLSPSIDILTQTCLNLYGNRVFPYILTEAEFKQKAASPLVRDGIAKGMDLI